MKKTYLGAICEGGGSFGIVFRDFPGCGSAGDTITEVLAMGQEALQGHVEVMVEHGDAIPEPTAHQLSDVAAWLDEPGEVTDERWVDLYPIEVDVPAYPEAIAIPIRSDIVREIAALAERERRNAQTLIEDAARRELERLRRSA